MAGRRRCARANRRRREAAARRCDERGRRTGRRRLSVRHAGESRGNVRADEGFLRPLLLRGARSRERPPVCGDDLRGKRRAKRAAPDRPDRDRVAFEERGAGPDRLYARADAGTHPRGEDDRRRRSRALRRIGAGLAAGLSLGVFDRQRCDCDGRSTHVCACDARLLEQHRSCDARYWPNARPLAALCRLGRPVIFGPKTFHEIARCAIGMATVDLERFPSPSRASSDDFRMPTIV